MLRNSPASADYETRAFYSWNPVLRYRHRRRYRLILDCIGDRQRVLDVGCGASQTLNAAPQSVGVDALHHKLWFMRRPARSLVNATATSLPFADAAFGAIIASRLLEHIQDGDNALREFARCLEKDGLLILGTEAADALGKSLSQHGFETLETEPILGSEVMLKVRKR